MLVTPLQTGRYRPLGSNAWSSWILSRMTSATSRPFSTFVVWSAGGGGTAREVERIALGCRRQ